MLVSMLVNSFLRSENIESSVSRRYSPLRRSMARCCNIQCGSKGLYLHNPTIGTAERVSLVFLWEILRYPPRSRSSLSLLKGVARGNAFLLSCGLPLRRSVPYRAPDRCQAVHPSPDYVIRSSLKPPR